MTNSTTSRQPRVLLFSQRNLKKDVLFRCPHYEFEDIICEMDCVDMVAPRPGKWFDQRWALANFLSWHSPLIVDAGVARQEVPRTYELLFTICGSPVDLLALNALGDWKSVAKRSICLIDEMWVKELKAYKFYLNILAKFDQVLFYYSGTAKAVNEAIGPKCRFVPPGVDALLFCPYPSVERRVVDVYSIGRRSGTTHQALLRLVNEDRRFYIYDSVSGSSAVNAKEHRFLFANTVKRSRYFIVNPGLIDKPEVRGDQSETGNRYFEGAASGAIMIGERPKNEEFCKMFDWPDAVLDLPYGSDQIGRIMDAVESDPCWEGTMRRNNVMHALLRHDWAYRWEAVLDAGKLNPLQGLLDRKSRLECLAKEIAVSDPRSHSQAQIRVDPASTVL